MKISDNINGSYMIMIGFTSYQLCFLKLRRITMFELVPLVIIKMMSVLSNTLPEKLWTWITSEKKNYNQLTLIPYWYLFSRILKKNVVLRWANKNEELSDAIISTIIQSKYDRSLGFGEVKPGNTSTKKHMLCMDTVRLATLSKNTIDYYSQDTCFSFQINGYRISFFMLYRQTRDIYAMVEIASIVFPHSLENLDSLITKKNLYTLARVSSSFWNNSSNLLQSSVSPSPSLPISTLYQLLSESHCNNMDTTSRY